VSGGGFVLKAWHWLISLSSCSLCSPLGNVVILRQAGQPPPASVVAAFFYVRVIAVMFFSAPTENTASVAIPSAFTTIALAASATITVVLGVIPQPVIEMVANAGIFIR